MTNMIDRVAKAIFASDMKWAPVLEHQFEENKIVYLKAAQAAIEAMREPTVEMLAAAAPYPEHLVIERNDVNYTNSMQAATAGDRMTARSKYQTMIDAALPQS